MEYDTRAGDVTYSPQDDKLRIYFATRQSQETLQPLKDAGFRWAGIQECWHAHWTPEREDAALAATGADALDDEPSTLADRAEQRAERFESYSANAARERDERWAMDRKTCELLNGQPILIGHHSEKAHRALLRRMWSNFFKGGEAGKRADYWARRADSPLAWATYKDKPAVRARRIKTLEADLRRFQRDAERVAMCLRLVVPGMPFEQLLAAANDGRPCGIPYGTWARLDKCRDMDPVTSAAEVAKIIEETRGSAERIAAGQARWIAHYEGRIAWEKQQLEAQGSAHMIAPKPRDTRRARLPLLNIEDGAGFRMTSAEYQEIHKDYRGTRIIDKRYRIRTALLRGSLGTVFLTDKRVDVAPSDASVAEDPRA